MQTMGRIWGRLIEVEGKVYFSIKIITFCYIGFTLSIVKVTRYLRKIVQHARVDMLLIIITFNLLSASPQNWSNALKQCVGKSRQIV